MIETDVIGPLYTSGVYGEPDPTTGLVAEIMPPVALTGWHINATQAALAARPDLVAYVVTPAHLRRVWAGDSAVAPVETVALRFANEAEARAVLGLGDA
jgi:hypothetical protein